MKNTIFLQHVPKTTCSLSAQHTHGRSVCIRARHDRMFVTGKIPHLFHLKSRPFFPFSLPSIHSFLSRPTKIPPTIKKLPKLLEIIGKDVFTELLACGLDDLSGEEVTNSRFAALYTEALTEVNHAPYLRLSSGISAPFSKTEEKKRKNNTMMHLLILLYLLSLSLSLSLSAGGHFSSICWTVRAIAGFV